MASRRTEKQNMLRNYEREKEEIRRQEEDDARWFRESIKEEMRMRQQQEDDEFLARYMNDNY